MNQSVFGCLVNDLEAFVEKEGKRGIIKANGILELRNSGGEGCLTKQSKSLPAITLATVLGWDNIVN
ncbi:hypothetical protein [Streptococcus oriscaviae]|uniref:Uncharacterized protein n=1 Tax=Streptococcus oriscaviae TaxID=2781599 RepID=A0ABX7YMK3_9STRE|nr:hypothetical protein [Streptococcus oriscaviae]QUE54923.1 hypothetical protein INT76_03305 [Streptococcus oriscaviae]